MINKPFERVSPESVGIHSTDVLRMLDKLSAMPSGQEPHHFLLIRHGKVAAEGHWAPYAVGMPHNLASVSKALTSTAVGFAVQEGLLSLDDKVVELLPDKLPEELQPEMRDMTVKILLEMGAGQECGDAHGGIKGEKRLEWQAKRKAREHQDDQAKQFFTTPLIYAPGTIFGYNGMCSYLLSLLVTRKSGMDLMDYLDSRLFTPLGIPKPHALRDKAGICVGEAGVFLSVEELAVLGQFYLQKGMWEGKQLLSAEWVTEACAKHLPTKSQVGEDWSQGYCWQFWRGRHNTFRFCGAFGQMCVCMPDLDALFVVQSSVEIDRMGDVLEIFYDTLIENMAPQPLPEDEAACQQLRQKCMELSHVAVSAATAADAAPFVGTWQFAKGSVAKEVVVSCNGSDIQAEVTLPDGSRITLCTGEPKEIGIVNTSGAPAQWATECQIAAPDSICFLARELSGFSRITLQLRKVEEKVAMVLSMDRFFTIVLDENEYWSL